MAKQGQSSRKNKKTNAVRKRSNQAAFARYNLPLKERKPLAKLGKTKEVVVKEKDEKGNETEVVYTLQHPGVKKAQEIIDATIVNGDGKVSTVAMYEQYMEHVIVNPKTNWEYWEEHEGMQQVMGECASFLNG